MNSPYVFWSHLTSLLRHLVETVGAQPLVATEVVRHGKKGPSGENVHPRVRGSQGHRGSDILSICLKKSKYIFKKNGVLIDT